MSTPVNPILTEAASSVDPVLWTDVIAPGDYDTLRLIAPATASIFYRGGAGQGEIEIPANPQGQPANYTATETDWHGVVVVNENGQTGEYSLRVNTCEPAQAIAANAYQTALGFPPPYSFTPTSVAWAAAGVFVSNPAQDWDLSLFHNYGAGGATPCWTGLCRCPKMWPRIPLALKADGSESARIGWSRSDPS